MNNKLIILYTIGSFKLGGAEAQLLMLASGMSAQGHDVHLFVVSDEGPLKSTFVEAGVTVHHGHYTSGASVTRRVLWLIGAQLRLISLMLSLRPDVVHNFLPVTNVMGAVAGALTRVPRLITSRRALGTHQERYPIWKPMDWIANALSHVITANSRAVAEDVVRRDGADPGKVKVIYNGIDLPDLEADLRETVRSELGFRKDALAIVSVANLIPYKGHREIITAMVAVVTRFPQAQLILIGEDRGIGPSLENLVSDLNLQNYVTMMGQRRNVPRLLTAMDVGILASHEEGFSNALLEMLHAGLPVVATRVGGNQEALEGMSGCTLIEPKAPAEIERALVSTLEGIDAARAEAEVRSLAIRTTYSRQSMLDHYDAIYRQQDC